MILSLLFLSVLNICWSQSCRNQNSLHTETTALWGLTVHWLSVLQKKQCKCNSSTPWHPKNPSKGSVIYWCFVSTRSTRLHTMLVRLPLCTAVSTKFSDKEVQKWWIFQSLVEQWWHHRARKQFSCLCLFQPSQSTAAQSQGLLLMQGSVSQWL